VTASLKDETDTPVVAIAPPGPTYGVMVSNIREM